MHNFYIFVKKCKIKKKILNKIILTFNFIPNIYRIKYVYNLIPHNLVFEIFILDK